MQTIEHEGKTYVLKADMEATIQERLRNPTTRATEAETKLAALQVELTTAKEQAGTAAALTQQIQDLQAEKVQLSGKMDRYQAATGAGITDADTIDHLEHAHQRAMTSVDENARVDFGTWLGSIKENPDTAPALLRPLFQPQQATAGQPQQALTLQPGLQGQQQATPPPVQQQVQQQAPPAAGTPGQHPAWDPATAGQQQAPPPAARQTVQDIRQATTKEELQEQIKTFREQWQG